MMFRLVTISFTGIDAGGGVPKFNRDIHAAWAQDGLRRAAHFSWDDFKTEFKSDASVPEWEAARLLNRFLIAKRLITANDIIVADGFWADGLQHFPRVVSVAHGIWSHLTAEDVAAGKQPDMPYHHAAQVSFRKRWMALGKSIVAVSSFIAEQMRLQWGWDVRVINNGVDVDVFYPIQKEIDRAPLVMHGVNDRHNKNKGWDHIEFLQKETHLPHDIVVMSLDETINWFESKSKEKAIGRADIFVHPSGYEGNSMMVAEVLASGIPIVAYDVGFLYGIDAPIGSIMPLRERSPQRTIQGVREVLARLETDRKEMSGAARDLAVRHLSIEGFRNEWVSYLKGLG